VTPRVCSLRASTRLHNQILQAIIKCPMSFFDATPLGRVLNRFSKALLGVVPVMYIYYSVFNYFRCTSREIKTSASRPMSARPSTRSSPNPSTASCLRAFNFLEGFEWKIQRCIDALNRVFWLMISCNRWLGLRLELCGNVGVALGRS
jgi:ATP-binding cassette subfamily C (CFTR/MRP) protein 1